MYLIRFKDICICSNDLPLSQKSLPPKAVSVRYEQANHEILQLTHLQPAKLGLEHKLSSYGFVPNQNGCYSSYREGA